MIARQEYFVNNYFAEMRNILVLVIKQAMAIALKIRIGDLIPEFLANALILFCALQAARTVSPGTLQAFLNGSHHFFVFIQSNSHIYTSLPDNYSTHVKNLSSFFPPKML